MYVCIFESFKKQDRKKEWKTTFTEQTRKTFLVTGLILYLNYVCMSCEIFEFFVIRI